MASKNWQVDASASWGTTADWSGGVPTDVDAATIAVAGITVSVGTGVAAIAYSLNTTYSILSVTGGTLETVQSALFDGLFKESAGTFTAAGTGAIFNDGLDFTGGRIDVASGAAQINDGGVLAGTLVGAGALDINEGNVYIDSGFSCSLASIVVGADSGKLGLNTNFSYANNLTVLQNGVLDLFGHTLTLSGASLLEGTIGLGSLTDTGTVTLGNPDLVTTLDDGLVVEVEGKMVQDGDVALGAIDAGAKITVGSHGQYNINGNWVITDPSSVGSIVNEGVFAKSFGGKSAIIDPSFSTTGKLEIEIGSLVLNGLVNSLSGTISGAGTLGIGTLGFPNAQTTLGTKLVLDVGAVSQASGEVVLNSKLAYAGIWNEVGGVLNLNATGAVLTLTGVANFDGGTVTSYGGSLLLDGAAHVGNVTFGGPTVVDINGTLDQTNNINFGLYSNPVANIASGAEWVVEADSAIFGFFGQINNSGTFIDPNGSGDAFIEPEINNSGTLTVDNSTLTLAGTNDLGGTLSGSGLLELEGTTTLAAKAVTVAALTVLDGYTALGANLTYAGDFGETGGTAVLDLEGDTLTLSGALSNASLDSGLLTDGGTLSVAGHVTIGNFNIGGGAELLITGTAEQTGTLNLAPGAGAGILDVAATGTYVLDDDLGIAANTGFGTISIAGTLDIDGAGTTIANAAVVEASTGHVQINDTAFEVGYGGAFAGSVSGAGTFVFAGLDGDAQYNLLSGVSLTSADLEVANNANVDLLTNLTYAGLFTETSNGTVTVGAQILTLSGTSSISGSLAGPGGTGSGTLAATGTSTIDGATVEQTAVLSITGTAGQYGGVTDDGLIVIGSAGRETINANSSIAGTGALSVAGGLFIKGDGSESISAAVSVAGSLSVDSGAVTFSGPVGVTGNLTVETGTVSIFGSLGVAGALIVETGTLSTAGSVSVGGSLTIESGTASMSGAVSVAGTLALDSGSLSISGAIVDTGKIIASLGTLSVLSAVSGTGSLSVGGGGLIDFGQGVTAAAATTVGFASGGGTLELNDLTNADFLAHIAGFASGDLIEMSGFNTAGTLTTSWNHADTALTITDSSGDTGTLTFSSAQNTLSITLGTSTTTGFVTLTHS
jgi:hypothetical protein